MDCKGLSREEGACSSFFDDYVGFRMVLYQLVLAEYLCFQRALYACQAMPLKTLGSEKDNTYFRGNSGEKSTVHLTNRVFVSTRYQQHFGVSQFQHL